MEDIDKFTLRLLATAESNAAAVHQLKPYGYRYVAPASTTNVDSNHKKRKREEDKFSKPNLATIAVRRIIPAKGAAIQVKIQTTRILIWMPRYSG